ncbi:SpoIVB peptidase S55 domain-containing protein [Bryobacter aggregatus]|uniref:SpoIVB peptidase S55 domain-containing protein n=1 Tax=Bryobacter aggregatus TaxID=360054 RepID=UPI0009B5B797|nr:SpoIVB peptidase S55 domain-containing protein [Bryobacter aggregatus]
MKNLSLLAIAALTVSTLFGQAPKAGKVDIFPMDQLKPGMKATAWTVFEGTQAEPVDIEIIGLWKNAWGPKQDIILAKMFGKALRTGVAGGMSGSPVYIDGKLVGAVSLRISVFSPDAICGITPIDLMLEINQFDSSKPPDSKTPQSVAGNRSIAVPDHVLSGAMMTPIETPLTFSGFEEATLRYFGPAMQQMGLRPVMGGAAGANYEVKPANDWKTSLAPGEPIVGVLVSGDMNISGLGTVTYNDGKKVLGFGHPFFNMGPVDMPMAKGDILTVLSSTFQPNKVGNATEIVGALRQDRHSGIQGLLGEQADTIPVTLKVRNLNANGTAETVKDFRFNVFVNQKWTPFLMTMTLFNSISGLNEFADETSYRISGKVDLDGLPSLNLANMAAITDGPLPPAVALATWWGDKFSRLYGNSLVNPKLKAVNATVDLIPERRIANIESAWMDKTDVEPGEDVGVKIFLQPYRGGRLIRDVKLHIPTNLSKGEHKLVLVDGDTLNRLPTMAGMANRFLELPQAVKLINQERTNNQLFLVITSPKTTVYLDDKNLTSLPGSVMNVLQAGRATTKPMLAAMESYTEAATIPFDYVVGGQYVLRFNVR